jgi:hypothetical protein
LWHTVIVRESGRSSTAETVEREPRSRGAPDHPIIKSNDDGGEFDREGHRALFVKPGMTSVCEVGRIPADLPVEAEQEYRI